MPLGYPICGTAKPQFFDSAGTPLSSGTLSVLNPADDTNKASYPTYDDAVATTNPNTNPLTLNARGEVPNGLWGIEGEDYKLVLKDAEGATIWTIDDINLPMVSIYPGAITTLAEGTAFTDDDYLLFVDDPGGTPTTRYITAANARASGLGSYWLRTALEIANSITPTDYTYEPGNVMRYGAVADSTTETAGTDCTTAFQNAVDSGHPVYVPEGWYSIEGTVKIWGYEQGSTQSEGGGRTFVMNSGARIERFSAASTNEPILHIQRDQNFVDGGGGIVAARLGSGFTKGLILYGQDPAETDHTADGVGSMYFGQVRNFKILGKVANTGYDGSVGFYVNSAKRKRGDFTSTNSCPVYYNTFTNIFSQQFDYPIHVSSEANFNAFYGCMASRYGRAAYSVCGYGNHFYGCKSETTNPVQTIWSITGITLGCPTTITVDTPHQVATGTLIRVASVNDTGAGTLESLLNLNYFEATNTGTYTVTIPVDTTGLAAWDSGGSISQERYVWYAGRKDDPFTPETDSDSDAATTTNPITAITKANPTIITCVDHGLTTEDKVRIKDIVDDGPNGDLEILLNDGHFQITSTGDDTFTIPVDTSGCTSSWSSGGTIYTDFLPILGSRANHFKGPVEFAFLNPTSWVRTFGHRLPVVGYDDSSTHEGTYGRNVADLSGTMPGGIGRAGQSDAAAVANNLIRTTATDINRATPVQYHDFYIRKLDDGSGSGYGSKYHRTYTGRMANMDESETYTILTVDNIGITAAGIYLHLKYVFKEAANQNTEAGRRSWLCPVRSGTGQTALLFENHEETHAHSVSYLQFSVANLPGKAANTGKFELKVQTLAIDGNANGFLVWVAEILHTNLDENGLDWDYDVTIQNGGLSDTGSFE
jgi:hypothetical protein